MQKYTDYFVSYRRDVSEKARQYLHGLMQAGSHKNMLSMSEVVPESDARNLQQFISKSQWNARAVLDQVARDTDQLIGSKTQAGLIIDESAFPKQGHESVGVARQWLGRLGKVDNGQVAVFGVVAKGRFATAIDTRLYLPEGWTKDAKRCEKAGVPQEERVFKTKKELALEIVARARANGVRYAWVGADAGYGGGPDFLFALEDAGEIFIIDIHKNFALCAEDAQRVGGEGKVNGATARGQKQPQTQSVEKFIGAQAAGEWTIYDVRQTSRGSLKLRVLRCSVRVWDAARGQARCYELLVSENPDGSDRKYSLSNEKESTSTQRLVWMQRQRYWVERCFEDGKGQCGMADYQLRGWNGWHHHMALVMLTMLFMLSERLKHQDEYPLLSCADIERLLVCFLPRRDTSVEEVLAQMQRRHALRRKAAQSHARRAASRPT